MWGMSPGWLLAMPLVAGSWEADYKQPPWHSALRIHTNVKSRGEEVIWNRIMRRTKQAV